MVNGIVIMSNGHNEVRSVNGGTEQELLDKIDGMIEAGCVPRDEVSYFDIKQSDWDEDRWVCTLQDGHHGYLYDLDLTSMFSESFPLLLDYIRPHMMTVKRNRDGYFGKWVPLSKSNGRDIRFVSYNTRGGDDGIGGFGNQIMFEIRHYDYYDDKPISSIFVLCSYNTSGWEDRWDHSDYFNAEKVLLTMTERMGLKGWVYNE